MTYTLLRRTLRAVLSSLAGPADKIERADGVGTACPDYAVDAAYEADEILRIRTGYDRAALLLHGDDAVPPEWEAQCRADAARRARGDGEPLAYILGVTPFFGVDFCIAPGCLIPRADTEVLVEEILAHMPSGGVLWDLCTGSGCVPCAVLLQRPDMPLAYGVERYAPPYAIAQENARRLGLAQRFIPCIGDVLRGDSPPFDRAPNVIAANPPYISENDCRTLDTQVRHEPLTALCGGEDGLDFYRAILAHYRSKLAPGGCFLFEIGCDQGAALTALAAEQGLLCTLRRDYAGHDRVAFIREEGAECV